MIRLVVIGLLSRGHDVDENTFLVRPTEHT